MVTVWYGGTDTSFALNNNVPIAGVHSGVWSDKAKSSPITTQIRDAAGNPTTDVLSAINGHYDFGVDDSGGITVYLDFGAGVYAVQPRDLGSQVAALAATVAALPSGGSGAGVLTGAAPWAPGAYTVGTVFIKPNGQYRSVKTAYTAVGSYVDATDDPKSTPLGPIPLDPAAFAPAAGAYRQVAFRTSAVLAAGLELDSLGIDMPSTGTWNQVVLGVDLYALGQDVLAGLWKLDGSNAEVLVATVPCLAGKVGNVWQVQRTDAATASSGSATITDASIGVYDKGRRVTHANIPGTAYVGQTMTPGTSFKLSSSPTSQVDVLTTGAIAGNITVGAAISHSKDDQIFARIIQPGLPATPGKGMKLRIMLGSETARVNTTPGVPTALIVTATTATTVALGWTAGSNSSQHVIEEDGVPIARVGGITTFTRSGLGLADAAGHDYAVRAQRGNAISAATATVHGTPTAQYIIVPQGSAGAMDGTKSTVTLGGTGSLVTFNNGGLDLTTQSGSVGNFNAADRTWVQFIGDTASYTAWETKGKFKMGTTNDVFDWYLSVNSGLITAMTNGVKFVIGAFNWKCQYMSTAFGSSSGGTGANGTAQTLTDSAYPITSSTSVVSGGSVPWASSLSAGTEYGYLVRQINNGDGTQSVLLKLGSSAQYGTDGSGLPTIATITLNTTMKADLQPGKLFYEQESGTTVGVSQSTDWTAMVHTPVAA